MLGPYREGVLGPYRAMCWDHTERCVETIQRRAGEYVAVCWDHTERVCWDHTERCVGTIQSGVLRPYREGQVSM